MTIIERVDGGVRPVVVDVTGRQDGDTIVQVNGHYRARPAAALGVTVADIGGLQALLDAKLDDTQAGVGLATLQGGAIPPEQMCPHTHPMTDVVGLLDAQEAQDLAAAAEASSRAAADVALDARLDALEAVLHTQVRAARVAVPAIPLLTTVDVPIVWSTPMPDETYAVTLAIEAGTGLLGQLRAVVKTGTITAAGVTVSMSAAVLISLGTAFLHATAADA